VCIIGKGWIQPSKGDTYKNVATDFQKDVTELFSKHEKRLEKTLVRPFLQCRIV